MSDCLVGKITAIDWVLILDSENIKVKAKTTTKNEHDIVMWIADSHSRWCQISRDWEVSQPLQTC